MEVTPLPLLRDNYAWLLESEDPGEPAAVVDPSEAAPVLETLSKRGRRLGAILLTHHHWDHTGGVAGLLEAFPEADVLCGLHERPHIEAVTRALEDGARFAMAGRTFEVLHTPGHTLGAATYYCPDEDAVFTGDTFFLAGCGRLFEGTAEQLYTSLQRIGALPARTRVYCGHEYTVNNLRFAATVEPGNPAILERQRACEALRSQGRPTVPGTIEEEWATNPFLRVESDEIREATGETDPVSVFAALRRLKDAF